HAQPYARGLEVGRWRGLRTVGHGGLWPGYRTELVRVPERDLAVVVIANVDALDPHRIARRAIDAVLAEEGLPAEPALPAWVAGHAGRWVDPANLSVLELGVAGGEATGRMNGASFAFLPTADGWLRAFRGAFEVSVRAAGDGLEADIGAGRIVGLAKVGPSPAPSGLAGTYRANELDTTWTIAEGAGGLAVRARGPLAAAGPWPIEAVAADVVEITMPARWLASTVVAAVERDGGGAVRGLRVSSGRIKDLRFTRV
ncbi:MAG: serine hydrolase, partial [Alphaproteobacteria bacterium]